MSNSISDTVTATCVGRPAKNLFCAKDVTSLLIENNHVRSIHHAMPNMMWVDAISEFNAEGRFKGQKGQNEVKFDVLSIVHEQTRKI